MFPAIGALGYLRKDEPAERFIRAVRTVAAGNVYVEPDAAGALIADLGRSRRRTTGTPVALPRPPADATGDDPSRWAALLTPCELEVLHLIGSGQTTRAIASLLHRSIKTIQTYRSRIRAKLGLDNPSALAQWAWRFVHAVGRTAA